ncbi:MAG: MFS transporter, partial [Campylobacterota bacterium]|nr:MFS transporter [Campylobacterota bacterium]
WFSNVAIFTMLVQFGVSPLIISFVAAMHFLPGIILSPLSGTIIDRSDIKKLMITLMSIELLMTMAFLLIDSAADVWLLMIVLFIRMGAASMFFSTEMTLLPKLISGVALQKANEIHSIIWSFTYAAGMAISGLVVHAWGIQTAFIIDALFFVAALSFFIPMKLDIQTSPVKEKVIDMIKDGWRYLRSHTIAVQLILLHASVGLTSFDALVTLLADYEYKLIIAVPLAIGISNAVRAFALMIGPLVIGSWVNKETLAKVFILQGTAIIIWGLSSSNFYISLIGLFLTGLFTTTIWSYTYALLQEKVEHKYLGRTLAYNEMIFMLSNVLTTLFIGLMASYVSLDIITIILGAAFYAVAYYYTRIQKWI